MMSIVYQYQPSMTTQVKVLEQTMINIPSADPFDPQYRRLSYVRYADDCAPRR